MSSILCQQKEFLCIGGEEGYSPKEISESRKAFQNLRIEAEKILDDKANEEALVDVALIVTRLLDAIGK